MTGSSTPEGFTAISPTHGDAWAAWNASYHEPNKDVYRTLGHALYRQAWHERIAAQLARLDEQNALLDAILATQVACARSQEVGSAASEAA
jgi:hypothetical protein